MNNPKMPSSMKTRVLLFAALLLAVAFWVAQPVAAAPSPALGRALRTLKDLTQPQFENVVRWARNGQNRPARAPGWGAPEDEATSRIGDLRPPDRNAVVGWLRGDGRSALYSRGANDGDIGDRRPVAVAEAVATPNPWRQLDFGSPTLGDSRQGDIGVLGGWAGVKRDGRGAHACISFKNYAPRTATRVLFEIPIIDDGGQRLAELHIDRHGTFSSGIDINGWDSLKSWQDGVGHRGYNDNCTGITNGVAAFPLLAARFATYTVQRVEYADGTSWSAQPAAP